MLVRDSFRKSSKCIPRAGGCRLPGCSVRQKGQRSASGLCETPREGSSSQQCCKQGDPCFICHNGWQSWGAADGLLLFDLVKLCVLQGSLTPLTASPRETRTQQGTCLQCYLLWYICAVSHTPLVGSPVSNLCHVYHHPKSLGIFFFSALTFLSLL